jgi:hypothetical protein
MAMYEGDDMTEVEPKLEGNRKKYIMVTHDESVFYANDGRNKGWFEKGEVQMRGKGPGLSIMVSEFQCACHGTMRYGDMVSRKLFEAGANRQGYWTHEDVVDQLKNEVIPIFKALHPNCMGVFLFDQSSNHKAFAHDALVAARMNRDPHLVPEDKARVKDTTFTMNGRTIKQTMYETRRKRKKNGTVKTYTYFKGVKRILEERGLWHDLDRSPGRENKKWRLFCSNNDSFNNSGNVECCARHCLANQPDFQYQLCALQETLQRAHLLCRFYPKFHCECNWIERYWADIKRYVRQHCDYTFSGLKNVLNDAFDAASPPDQPPIKIRRYYMRCWRYIEAYSRNLNAKDAEKDVCNKFRQKTYLSHRKLGITD